MHLLFCVCVLPSSLYVSKSIEKSINSLDRMLAFSTHDTHIYRALIDTHIHIGMAFQGNVCNQEFIKTHRTNTAHYKELLRISPFFLAIIHHSASDCSGLLFVTWTSCWWKWQFILVNVAWIEPSRTHDDQSTLHYQLHMDKIVVTV